AQINHYVHAGTDRVTHRPDFFYRKIGELAIHGTPGHVPDSPVARKRKRVAFEGRVSVLDRPLSRARVIIRGEASVRPTIRIDPNIVPQLPSEHLVNRHIKRPALDVPHRLLDGAQAREDYRSAASFGPERMVVHVAPQFLDTEGIASEDEGFDQILDHSSRRGPADSVSDRRFTYPGNAAVREQLEQHRMQAADFDQIDIRP